MHVLATTEVALGEIEAAVDLGQNPADIVALSFTDSDLSALAAAWSAVAAAAGRDGTAPLPSLRLASLKRLRHPMSVDLYVERVITGARIVLVRCLGGLDYWRYGIDRVGSALRGTGGLLAALPGDDRADPRLAEASTVEPAALGLLDRYLREGGIENAANALKLAASLIGHAQQQGPPVTVGATVRHRWEAATPVDDRPTALVVFYRANVLAGDTAPIDAVCEALEARGMAPLALAVTSLKDPAVERVLADVLESRRPRVILNATAFSARRDCGCTAIDAAGCPVLQVVLAGCDRPSWQQTQRGLGQTDLAMHVVLPELDGRLLTRAISFKGETAPDPRLEFSAVRHLPDEGRIAFVADQAAAWVRLGRASARERRVALVLSDYPGRAGRAGYAVGLDTAASVASIADALSAAGYELGSGPVTAAGVEDLLAGAKADEIAVALETYLTWLGTLPAPARAALEAAWGDPASAPELEHGQFRFRVLQAGNITIALQPGRGRSADRKASYHDMALPPCHAYVAFYLWLRRVGDIHALIHLGTHGTLEWLPGKALALSDTCWPEILTGPLPVLYPFIVNNPGEAVHAKRRLSAVAIGHLTPPLSPAGLHGAFSELETLIEELAQADGLDRRRTGLIEREIIAQAFRSGLAETCGITRTTPIREAITRLDAELCDIKELAIRGRLHVFGRPMDAETRRELADGLAASTGALGSAPPVDLPRRLGDCAYREREALLAGLAGRAVAPGPAGAPTRGRLDVLPTGRNLTTADPRAMPTRVATTIGARAADEVIRRHMQTHGEAPRSLVIDLWASASLRTGGEDIAQALAYLGARPTWDPGSGRVTGIEVLPPAALGRPRIDVTARVSGLYRDIFEGQIDLLDIAVQRIAALDEDEATNPLAASRRRNEPVLRVFGGGYGTYGTGVSAAALESRWQDRAALGRLYLDATTHAFTAGGGAVPAGRAFERQVAGAAALVHAQDDGERDVLDGDGVADFAGAFAAAAAHLGNRPALYLIDTSRPEAPRARDLPGEVARIVRGRLTNARWIAGMLRHGHRGVAEIAQGVDALYAFAATTPGIAHVLFDEVDEALLRNPTVWAAMRAANAAAADAIADRLDDARARGLWHPRRNTAPSPASSPAHSPATGEAASQPAQALAVAEAS